MMRLLQLGRHGEFSLTRDFDDNVPPYAILSHTWNENNEEEVTFDDIQNKSSKRKAGYVKLQFCGRQARKDGLEYFWVDTCCINKANLVELSEAINSMFRWYRDAAKCYVYLSDVSTRKRDYNSQTERIWKPAFQASRWFKRGWTLQELVAPKIVEFFSREEEQLGDKTSLEELIHKKTQIPVAALRGTSLTDFSVDERKKWAAKRETKKKEDMAYCLLGIFDVFIPLIYGEGENAFTRLEEEIDKKSGTTRAIVAAKPSLAKIDALVHETYLRDGYLTIERLSGRVLPMNRCFINLGIIDRVRDFDRKKAENSLEKLDTTVPSRFSLTARLKVETPPANNQVTLQTLFKARQQPDGTTVRPNRILIWGRAGVGKTTLCKKIVYDFLHSGLWSDLFSRVYWLPLRRLKMMQNEPYSVGQIIQTDLLPDEVNRQCLVEVLQEGLKNDGKHTLFILDGLDEVSYAWDPDTPMGRNLNKLLKQDNVIITSRPHSTYVLDNFSPDLELETIGFFPAQVEEYLEGERREAGTTEEKISEIRSFVQGHPLIHSLARIPIQLDAICYAWSAKKFPETNVTMTKLYQAITQQLWKKDIIQLGKKNNGERITRQQIQTAHDSKRFVEDEVDFLQELAFACLYNEIVEFDSEHIRQVDAGQKLVLGDHPVHLSFLRSSDNSLSPVNQTYHFIHLTFQEFFAAQYFVRKWVSRANIRLGKMDMQGQQVSKSTERIEPEEFLGREKYNARYDIFWRFVVGILHSEEDLEHLRRFFDVVEDKPRDLLGSTHQRLVIHCLSEIGTAHKEFEPRVQELEDFYWKWITFELKFNSSISLLQEAECPDQLLIRSIQESKDGIVRVMRALMDRPFVSAKLLDQVISQLDKPDDRCMYSAAFQLLGEHCSHISGEKFFDCFPLQYKKPRLKFVEGLANSWKLGRSAVEALVRLLQDEDADVRWGAAAALGGQSTLPASAVEALVRLLQDEDADVRSRAAAALGGQSTLPASAVEALVRLLQDEDADVRSRAAAALGGQSTLPASAVEALVRLLQDEDYIVRWGAAAALGRQSTLPASAVEALVRLLQDEDADVRSRAAAALGRQSTLPASAVDALVRLLQDADADVRSRAAAALDRQSTLPASAVDALVRLLQDEDADVRSRAAAALDRQSTLPASAVDALVRLPQDEVLSSEAARSLANCEYFYSVVPTLASSTLQSLFTFWLQSSFKYSATCFVRTDTLFIDIHGKVRKIRLGKGQREAFECAYIEAQAAIGIPQPSHGPNKTSGTRLEPCMDPAF